MNEDRSALALARIDAALSRLEAASARAPAGDPALAERHDRLRGEVTRALSDLDALIAGATADNGR